MMHNIDRLVDVKAEVKLVISQLVSPDQQLVADSLSLDYTPVERIL